MSIKGTEFNVSNLSFSDVQTDSYKRRFVYANYKDRRGPVLIETPMMWISDMSKYTPEGKTEEETSFRQTLSFVGLRDAHSDNKLSEADRKNLQDLKTFHSNMAAYDAAILNAIYENGEAWQFKKIKSLTKEQNIEQLEDKYINTLKISTDVGRDGLPYPDKMDVKLNRERDENKEHTGRFVSNTTKRTPVLVFNKNDRTGVELTERNFMDYKKVRARCILQLVYINLNVAGKYSTTWRLIQMNVYPTSSSIDFSQRLINEDEPEQDDLDDLNEGVNNVQLNEAPAESDSESDEEEVVLVKPATPPPVVQSKPKTTRKRTTS